MTSKLAATMVSIATLAILLPDGPIQAAALGSTVSAGAAPEWLEKAEYPYPAHKHRYYKVNRYGYGRFVHGPNGSYGGYPAGSAGARELQIDRQQQCRDLPESC